MLMGSVRPSESFKFSKIVSQKLQIFPVYLNDADNMSASNFTMSALSCKIWSSQSSVDED